MSDFDFDEIDKAVTGALGSDDQSTNSDAAPRSEASQNERTNDVRPEVRPVPAQERTQQAAPAVRRNAGRFMDVVHPSSDMRTAGPRFAPPVSQSASPAPSPAPAVSESEAPAPTPTTTTEEAWAKPLESPFLADAKVEKRPLGGFSLESTKLAFDEGSEDEELLLEAPDEPRLEASSMPDPIDFAAHSNALPSESEDTGAPVEQETESPKATELTPEEPRAEIEPSIQPDEPARPVAPASITQQYTEQPSSAPASGAIYDTENYHQPLAAAPKKRHGIWVALWIFLLVVLGAGAGVAFYLFVLPML